MKKKGIVIVFYLLLTGGLGAQNTPLSETVKAPGEGLPIPQWLLDEWAARARESGTWIADNTSFQSENEPFDAYGLHWEYGLGKKSLRGRLYCIRDGKAVGTVWQFLEFWDPAAGQARIVQIGSDGTVGQGRIWSTADGGTREEQRFTSPGGGSFQTRHHAWMENGSQHTQSFSIEEGVWVKGRLYIWNLAPEVESPDLKK